jgi:hypothetical protein
VVEVSGTEAELDAKLDALKESKAESYVAAEPQPEAATPQAQPQQATANKPAKRLGELSAAKQWSKSPLGDRVKPSERLHAVTALAVRLNEAGVSQDQAEAALLALSQKVQAEGSTVTAELVCVYFDTFASQRGWEHFVRDTKLAMAGALKGVELGQVAVDPRSAEAVAAKATAKPQTAEEVQAAILKLQEQLAALQPQQPAAETQPAQ